MFVVSVCTGSIINIMSYPDYCSCQAYLKQNYFHTLKKMVLYQISLATECHYLLRSYTGQKAASCLNQMTSDYFLGVFTFSIQKQAVRWPWSKGLSLDTLNLPWWYNKFVTLMVLCNMGWFLILFHWCFSSYSPPPFTGMPFTRKTHIL